MKHRIALVKSEEGYAVSCPALKGCHSQGATREEAILNIRDAIREWLAADDSLKTRSPSNKKRTRRSSG